MMMMIYVCAVVARMMNKMILLELSKKAKHPSDSFSPEDSGATNNKSTISTTTDFSVITMIVFSIKLATKSHHYITTTTPTPLLLT